MTEMVGPFLRAVFDTTTVFLEVNGRVLVGPPDWINWPTVRASELGSDAWKTGPPPLIGPPDHIKSKKSLKTRG
jgi:hypothetical protein